MTSSNQTDKTSLEKTSQNKVTSGASLGSKKEQGLKKEQPVYASDAVAMVEKRSKNLTAEDSRMVSRTGQPNRVSETASRASEMAGPNQGGRPSPTDRIQTPASDSLELTSIPSDVPMEDRPGLVLRMAEEVFSKTGSWVVFYREMMAPGGIVDQLYETGEARRYFEATDEFAELLEMVTSIRSQDDSKTGTYEPERVITVRLPRSMHEGVVREAKELELSINKYCLTKLLQPANSRFTPIETGARRGRRPGPQITLERVKISSEPPKPRKSRKRKSS